MLSRVVDTHHRACALVTVHSYAVLSLGVDLPRRINTHASLNKSSVVSGSM